MTDSSERNRWRELIEWLESMRGMAYICAIIVPLLSGVLLMFAFMPAQLAALDTVRALLVSMALCFLPSFQAGILYGAAIQLGIPADQRTDKATFLAMALGISIAGMTIGSAVMFAAFAKWMVPQLSGKATIPFALAMFVLCQVMVVLKFHIRRRGWPRSCSAPFVLFFAFFGRSVAYLANGIPAEGFDEKNS